ncbi:MAG: hypothetical protein LC785_18315 [Acidobacteria bacterium]|nr:hypothetical protein [Acidobacteriota bacterium]MCA1643840.1 hypothetical protein [Acidobacteriota bacterium]
MFSRVLRFVRMPLALLLIWAALRFFIGLRGVPYAPRGNAMFSVVGLTVISCLYFGAMSRRVGNFSWVGTILVGAVIGLWAQILIFTATVVSIAANLNTYFVHWDALNIPEGTHATMAQALTARGGGLLFGTILGSIVALIGRAVFSALAPSCGDDRG